MEQFLQSFRRWTDAVATYNVFVMQLAEGSKPFDPVEAERRHGEMKVLLDEFTKNSLSVVSRRAAGQEIKGGSSGGTSA